MMNIGLGTTALARRWLNVLITLERAQPIMCCSEADGLTMFQAGSKFYFWNEIECGVWEILSSQVLGEIIKIMSEIKGEPALKIKELAE
jgi:hypothetical protein